MMQNHLKFYPCKHTRQDGLMSPNSSKEETGRHTILIPKPINREITIKRCIKCSKED